MKRSLDVHFPQYAASRRLRIIVLCYIVRGPLGGLVWHHLQYLLGLASLGHDVYCVEDSDNYASCYHPSTNGVDMDPTEGIQWSTRVMKRVGLGERWAYHDAHTSTWHGPRAGDMISVCRTADLLINVSAVNPIRPWLADIPVRIYIDTDPAFTQIRHLTDPAARSLALRHTHFFSFGENLRPHTHGQPDDGLPWKPTRQPVVLSAWPVSPGPPRGKFRTVMQWDSYRPREYDGRRFGMKSESFMMFLDLPRETGRIFELALGSATAPRSLLRQRGWIVRNSLVTTKTPWTYQRFIRGSKAEITVAKHGYVASNSGWFSERSANFLASGRPVLSQDTGFSEYLPAGRGIVAFRNLDDAVAGVEEINGRYDAHCRAAREIAQEYFDARKVLKRLIDAAMNSS